jgi:hypothetical protein
MHAVACADDLIAVLMDGASASFLVALDRGDPQLLHTRPATREGIATFLPDRMTEQLSSLSAEQQQENKYLRGARLREIVKERVTRWLECRQDEIHRIADSLIEKDEYPARPHDIRELVMLKLNNAILDLCVGQPNPEVVFHLKILTLMTASWGTEAFRAQLFSRLGDHRTSSFPFVVKYLVRDKAPRVPPLPDVSPTSIVDLAATVSSVCPQAEIVARAVDAFCDKRGFLNDYLDIDKKVEPSYSEAYDQIREYSTKSPGGLYVPKSVALREHRRVGYRIPEGVVCAIGLLGMIEVLLAQVRFVLEGIGSTRVRPTDAVRRILQSDAKFLSRDTNEDLDLIFPQRGLSLRDLMAHGAFFFADVTLAERSVGLIVRCFRGLVGDILRHQSRQAILSRSHEGISLISESSVGVMEEQLRGAPLTGKMKDIEEIEKATEVIKLLTPDKIHFFRAAMMAWASRKAQTPIDVCYGLILGVIVVEELLRARFEEDAEVTLRVTPDGEKCMKFELAILDDTPGNLLEKHALERVFGSAVLKEPFPKVVLAVRQIRDAVMHGRWSDLAGHEQAAHDLVLKWLLSVAGTLQIERAVLDDDDGRRDYEAHT